MAEVNILDVQKIPGQIYSEPTDPDSLTPADWGTPLGVFDSVILTIALTEVTLVNKIKGVPYEKIDTVEVVTLAALLRSFDADALALAFPDVATQDTASTKPLIVRTGGIGGRRASKRAKPILLRPTDPEFHPCVFLSNASAGVAGAGVNYQIDKEFGHSLVFTAFPDSLEDIYKHGYVQDITV